MAQLNSFFKKNLYLYFEKFPIKIIKIKIKILRQSIFFISSKRGLRGTKEKLPKSIHESIF